MRIALAIIAAISLPLAVVAQTTPDKPTGRDGRFNYDPRLGSIIWSEATSSNLEAPVESKT